MRLTAEERTEQETRRSMRERIRAGMAVLDTHEPGWDAHIDLTKLDLGNSEVCIVGQLIPESAELDSGYDEFEMPEWLAEAGELYPDAWGFDVSEEDYKTEFSMARLYSMLTEEWLDELRARRT